MRHYMVCNSSMFLYPIWIILSGILISYGVGKLGKNRFLARFVFFLSLCSSFLASHAFTGYSRSVSVTLFYPFVVFEINSLNAFLSLTGVSIMLILFGVGCIEQKGIDDGYDTRESFFLPLILLFSVSAFFASNIPFFLFCFEASFLCFIPLLREKQGELSFSFFDYSLYFLPTLFGIYVYIILAVKGGNNISELYVSKWVGTALGITFAMRLFLVPLSFSGSRVLKLTKRFGVIHVMVVLSVLVFTGFIKFFRNNFELTYMFMICSILALIISSIYVFRQKTLREMSLFLYITQISYTAAAIALGFLSGEGEAYLLWTLSGYAVASLGVLYLSADRIKHRSLLNHLVLTICWLSFFGLFPSTVFYGRWNCLITQVSFSDWFGALIIAISAVAFVPSVWCIKSLVISWKVTGVTHFNKRFSKDDLFCVIIMLALVTPLFFTTELNHYFSFIIKTPFNP